MVVLNHKPIINDSEMLQFFRDSVGLLVKFISKFFNSNLSIFRIRPQVHGGLLDLLGLRDTMVPKALPVLQGPQDLLDRRGLVTFHFVLTRK